MSRGLLNIFKPQKKENEKYYSVGSKMEEIKEN
jgi:hypothetical protein